MAQMTTLLYLSMNLPLNTVYIPFSLESGSMNEAMFSGTAMKHSNKLSNALS